MDCSISAVLSFGRKVGMRKRKDTKGILKEKITGATWLVAAIGKGLVTGVMIAWLFFQSTFGLFLAPVCIAMTVFRERKKAGEKAREKEQEAFAEYLGFLKEALAVGYSMEQAVGEARKGLLTTRKEGDSFVAAAARMEHKLQLGLPVETAFAEWAKEACCEEIREFSEVLFIAKRTGGAVQQVIENTEHVIRDKQETLRYIRSVLYSREYEAKVMKLMPFAILLYLQLFMSDFLKPLYHNALGVGVMSVVLIVYFVLCGVVDKVTAVSM